MVLVHPAPRKASSLNSFDNELSLKFRKADYSTLLAELEGISPSTAIEERIILHYQAQCHMYLQNFNKSKMILLKASSMGENIQVLRDLCCCYYHLGEVDLWKEKLAELEKKLGSREHLLHFKSRHTTRLVLAKLLEEQGEISKALRSYRTLSHDPELKKGSDFYFQLQPQLLRLLSTFSIETSEINQLYRELISYSKDGVPKDFRIEVEHALISAELCLVGPKTSWERLKAFILCEDYSDYDKRFLLFDFVEETAARGLRIEEEVISFAKDYVQVDDPYEYPLFMLTCLQQKLDNSTLNFSSHNMSNSCYLRLLALCQQKLKGYERKELQARYELIIGAYEQETQDLWSKRLNFGIAESQQTKLQVDPKSGNVVSEVGVVNIRRRKTLLQLLIVLTRRPEMSIDQAISELWKESYSPEAYHRLRMASHRINQLTREIIPQRGEAKLINVDCDRVRVNPDFKITFVSNSEEKTSI